MHNSQQITNLIPGDKQIGCKIKEHAQNEYPEKSSARKQHKQVCRLARHSWAQLAYRLLIKDPHAVHALHVFENFWKSMLIQIFLIQRWLHFLIRSCCWKEKCKELFFVESSSFPAVTSVRHPYAQSPSSRQSNQCFAFLIQSNKPIIELVVMLITVLAELVPKMTRR